MTRVISIRVPIRKLAEMDRRAAASGLGRTGYLLRLLDQDTSQAGPAKPRAFKSKHLLGRFKSSGSTNAKVRAALKKAAHEKNR
jgi:hypothetical protein